jgi:medium-chain acyl-[acyl-carrier-protein] hydrolase
LQDEYVSRAQLEAWREQTDVSCTLRMLPGDHFFLNTARPLLLRTLARELDQLSRLPSMRRIQHAAVSYMASSS